MLSFIVIFLPVLGTGPDTSYTYDIMSILTKRNIYFEEIIVGAIFNVNHLFVVTSIYNFE
jgi:hypothetical protein